MAATKPISSLTIKHVLWTPLATLRLARAHATLDIAEQAYHAPVRLLSTNLDGF